MLRQDVYLVTDSDMEYIINCIKSFIVICVLYLLCNYPKKSIELIIFVLFMLFFVFCLIKLYKVRGFYIYAIRSQL